MKKVLAVSVALSLLVLALGQVPAVAGDKGKTHEMTAEVVSVDMAAKTITIKDDKGENHTAPLLGGAAESAKNLKPGDKVSLTCQDDANGQHQGVAAIKPMKGDKK